MMIRTVLFDLDDTLLGNDMDHFLPHYLPLLARHVRTLIPNPDFNFVEALLEATNATIGNLDPQLTNSDAFWQALGKITRRDWLALDAPAFFDTFYNGPDFQGLEKITTRRSLARPLVERLLAAGREVVVATNPLFPRSAIEARLAWAGLPVSEIPFTLITVSEEMHATKPHVAYYREILDRLGRRPEEALMVGNDWENDIAPAAALGLATFWVAPDYAEPPQVNLYAGRGDLAACDSFLQSIGL